ncbi:hypothetical protein DPX39_040084900 [Trypanosoma brucei equiperdum]|uniref:Uncharacterized protein n=1 Tax=Trypanosoma brucei equiperdum TaxID=630700 RepID=A0A3L6L9Y9_9TRYP|nr:hypothetical protein DPX39_040084900 [Trypanosoma brucei equiperdum]
MRENRRSRRHKQRRKQHFAANPSRLSQQRCPAKIWRPLSPKLPRAATTATTNEELQSSWTWSVSVLKTQATNASEPPAPRRPWATQTSKAGSWQSLQTNSGPLQPMPAQNA